VWMGVSLMALMLPTLLLQSLFPYPSIRH
jgi:hypothetical protein